jgi:hypothetical protein
MNDLTDAPPTPNTVDAMAPPGFAALKSLASAASIPACRTFTATSMPSGSFARCTCPMLATAIGVLASPERSSSARRPNASRMVRSTSTKGLAGDAVWSTESSRRSSGDSDGST